MDWIFAASTLAGDHKKIILYLPQFRQIEEEVPLDLLAEQRAAQPDSGVLLPVRKA